MHSSPRERYRILAGRIRAAGYLVIDGYGKGGFWVRNPDMTKPPFVDGNSFIRYTRAEKLFGHSEAPPHGG
jgi:hypothetical protein